MGIACGGAPAPRRNRAADEPARVRRQQAAELHAVGHVAAEQQHVLEQHLLEAADGDVADVAGRLPAELARAECGHVGLGELPELEDVDARELVAQLERLDLGPVTLPSQKEGVPNLLSSLWHGVA